MDTPTRRSAASQSRSQRRSANASPYSRSKSVAGRLNTTSDLPLVAPPVASAVPRTSSIRSLFNIISSPFRSAAPAPQPAQDDESDGFSSSGESDDFSEEDEGPDAGRRGEPQREEGLKFGWGTKGKERELDGTADSRSRSDKFLTSAASRSSAGQWAAANSLASFSPRIKPQATHAHALLQMEPSPSQSQPKYLASSGNGGMTRSSTMPALDGFGRGEGARRLLREAEVGAGISEADESDSSDIPEVQRLFTTGPAARAPAQALRPLFHPGSSATATPSRPTASSSGSVNGGLARSTSNLSFLSPSRFAARPSAPPSASTSTAAASPSSYSFASRPGTGTPARRRPIYVGPGAGSPASIRKKTPAMALEFLRAAERKDDDDSQQQGGTPGKRRRVDAGPDEEDGEEARVERELSGLLGASSSVATRPSGGMSSSASVPANLSASTSRNQPPSPFTFKPPPPPAPAFSPAPTSDLASKRSYSTIPRAFLKNPSLVAPSPLRQSTSFGRDSPEAAKSGGVSPPAAGGKRKERTESAKLLLGLINADKPEPAPAPPAPPAPKAVSATPAKPSSLRASTTPAIQNPYQSSGLASPSPRRNPRRSVAATNRSSKLAAASPAKTDRSAKKAVTALDLIEQDVRMKEGAPASPTPASAKRQKPSAPAKDMSEEPAVDEQPSPVKAVAAAPPAWASTPPPVVHFAPPPKVTSVFSAVDDAMDGPSPTRRTLDLFDTLKSPAFAKSPAAPSSPAPAAAAPTRSGQPSPPPAAPKPPPAAAPPSFTTSTKTPFIAASTDPKDVASKTDKRLLPIFTFVFSSTATPLPTSVAETQARREAKVADKASLPKFDLLAPASASAPAPPPTAGGFDWSAAGMKAPAKPAANSWTCGVCMVVNGADKAKCISCEEPAPKKAAPAALSGSSFNWAAAGVQAPPKAPADSWTCGVCTIVNPSDKSKCLACEEPKPTSAAPAPPSSSSPAPAPAATGGFNWAAAGVKPPPSAPASSWTCGVCTIVNPDDKLKCLACEEPKPKSSSSSTAAPSPAAPVPLAGGFNWAAAGMAAPVKKNGWECGVCMVHNDGAGDKCVSCESPK